MSKKYSFLWVLMLLMGACPTPERDTIRFGLDPAFDEAGLGPWLKALYEEHSGERIKLVPMPAERLVTAVEAGELDEVLVASELSMNALKAKGLLVEVEPMAHEEFVVIGPHKNVLGSHAGSRGVTMYRDIARSNYRLLEPHPDSLEGGMHEWLFRQTRDRIKPGIWFASKLSGQQLVRAAIQGNTFALVRRSSLLLTSREGHIPHRIWADADPELVLVFTAGRIHPQRTKGDQERAARFHKWLVGPEAKKALTTFGEDRVGHPFFGAGAPLEGQGATFAPLRPWLKEQLNKLPKSDSTSSPPPKAKP
ncbi:MAG: substrate-binding domain-containing protein [Myxococcales bacterium]|nr:substrate-binding domain-containing protein [Myxococcales bacterium]